MNLYHWYICNKLSALVEIFLLSVYEMQGQSTFSCGLSTNSSVTRFCTNFSYKIFSTSLIFKYANTSRQIGEINKPSEADLTICRVFRTRRVKRDDKITARCHLDGFSRWRRNYTTRSAEVHSKDDCRQLRWNFQNYALTSTTYLVWARATPVIVIVMARRH